MKTLLSKLKTFLVGSLAIALVVNTFVFVPFVYAATCSISSNTTIDQTYITTNSCGTINISGTTTVTWSGTTDLVGAGDVNVTSGTATFSGAAVLGSTDTMSVSSGATITHAQGNTTGVNITASSLTVTGSINANSKGCLGGLVGFDGEGPNTSTGVCAVSTSGYGKYRRGGAAHGGTGGWDYFTQANNQTTTYGSNTAPILLGSGGGAGGNTGELGGNGGGIIRLSLSDTLTVGGSITANGGNAVLNNGGGGSGGSIYITTVTIAGAGSITVNGGNGPTDTSYDGGGGGGGRAALYYSTNSSFTIANITATLGNKGAGHSGANQDGSAGTVYTFQYTVPSTPSLSAPTTATYNVSVNPTLTGSTYSSNGASHTSSDWKITTDSGGNTSVWSKTTDTSNLTSIVVNTTNGTFSGALSGQTALASNTAYYAFVRYNNSAGSSSWSTAILFTTANASASSTQTWNFDDATPATSFTYNSTYVEINASSNGYARLKDQGGTTFAPSPPSTLAAWTKRKTITVTNNVASTLTNFQTKVVVTYDSDMQADFDDVRFTDSSGTAISYWLESKTNSSTATYWVEVPSISASSTATVYMYYGNSGASSAGSGADTFTFFDDFDGSSLDTTKWAITNSGVGSNSVSGGLLTVTSNTGDLYNTSDTAYFLTSVSSFGSQYVAETFLNSKTTETYGRSFGVRSSSEATAKFYNLLNDVDNSHHTTTWRDSVSGSAGYAGNDTGIVNPGNTEKKAKFIVNGDAVTGYYNDTQVGTRTVSGWGLTNIMLMDVAATGSNVYDWAFVRQYAATDPSSSFGAEVDMSSGSQIQVAVASGGSHPAYVNLGTLTETRSVTSGQGSTFYQISKDGTNWKYYTGGSWQSVSSDATDRNTISEVQSYLPKFTTDVGTGDFYFKVLLVSVGTQPVEIDSLALTYQAAIVNLSASTQTVAENVGTVTVTATLNTALASDLTVPYTVTGTATGGGTDHNLANGNITITASQTSGSTSFSVTADAIDETNETVIVTLGTPSGATLGDTTVQTITITDDDTAAITVGAISGHTTEAGGTATFTVVLGSQPTADVSIGLSSSDTTEGTVLPSSLTFTSGNWSSAQTVTVTGVNDSLDDGDISYSIVTAAASSGDTNYNAVNPSDVSVTNDDNDTSGFTVSAISGNVTEAGGTATFTVVLTAQPTDDVSFNVSSGDTTEGTVSPSSLTFTNGNWSTPQTVTVTGVNDDVDDGDISFSIVNAAASSADTNYNNVNPADVSVSCTDNDTAGVTVGSISGHTTEVGGTATFTVVLNSQPTNSVSIGITSNDTTEGTVSTSSLSFSTVNWATPQTITVTGVDDFLDDGNITYSIVTATATSTDTNYNSNPSDVTVINDDNDTSGFTIGAISGNVSETGTTATYTVVLTAQPTADVVMGVSSSDTTEATVSSSSLTFSALNWNTPQTVTVTGVDDELDDGDVVLSLVNATPTSGDSNYSVINPSDVAGLNLDDDTVGLTLSSTALSTTEGTAVTYTVVLEAEPTVDVEITVTPDAQVTVGSGMVTFTSLDWSVPQTVTVTPIDDTSVEGVHTGVVTHFVSSLDLGYDALSLSSVTVTITDNDTNSSSGVGFVAGGGGGKTTHQIKPGSSSDNGSSDSSDSSDSSGSSSAFVAPDHWSQGYMKNLIQEQYIVQVAASEVTFFDILTTMFTKPNEGMDRGQTLEFLLVLSGVDVGTVSVDTSRPAFTDVNPTYERAAYVEFAYQAGLVTGYPDGSFQPTAVVNRAESLKMVTTFFDYEVDRSLSGDALLASYGLSENPFSDVSLDTWYAPYVLFMYTQGVVKGYGDGTFGPGNPVTYAELLKIATLSQNIEKAVELASELE